MRRPSAPVIALACAVLVASCGSGDASDDSSDDASDDIASTGAEAPPTAPAAADASDSAGDSPAAANGSLCNPLLAVDLSTAFGGTLQFGEVSEFATSAGCTIPIAGAEGEGLLVQLTIPENYEAKALFEEQGFPFKSLDGLGQTAFIVNEADLNVLIDTDTALSVGLSAFFVGDVELPEPATVEAGLVAVAEAVLSGL